MRRFLLAFLLCLSIDVAVAAPSGEPTPQAQEQLVASVQPQAGKITLPSGVATLDLPAEFRYLSPDDTDRVLQAWGNPPGAKTLGMIVPAAVGPLDQDSWGVVVTYDKDGHVKDDDADGIDYAKLLKTMQEQVAENNDERKKQGYQAMSLVGWAEAPHYDKANHKLYWAKELRREGAGHSTLNYNIRVLGREGVLVLNAVAGLEQLAQIKTEMQKVTAATNFTAGNRYADFNGSTDKVAEYGIAALIAGGVAAKLGFFAKLFALLVAFKKIVLVAVIAGGSAVWKFLKRMTRFGRVDDGAGAVANTGADLPAVDTAPRVDLSKKPVDEHAD